MKGYFARNAVRTALGAALVALLIAAGWPPQPGARAVAATTQEPMAEVKSVIDRAARILRDRQLSLPERRRELRNLAGQYFEFPAMARSAMGSHWSSLSSEQRAQYTQLFTDFIEAAYLDKIQGYVDLKFQFVSQRTSGGHYAEVVTNVLQPDSEPINLKFELQREAAGWRVYDVVIDGVSMLDNYRTQFHRVITRHGFNVLMEDLRLKQKQLAALLGNPQQSGK